MRLVSRRAGIVAGVVLAVVACGLYAVAKPTSATYTDPAHRFSFDLPARNAVQHFPLSITKSACASSCIASGARTYGRISTDRAPEHCDRLDRSDAAAAVVSVLAEGTRATGLGCHLWQVCLCSSAMGRAPSPPQPPERSGLLSGCIGSICLKGVCTISYRISFFV
jgi:hypothetical protein